MPAFSPSAALAQWRNCRSSCGLPGPRHGELSRLASSWASSFTHTTKVRGTSSVGIDVGLPFTDDDHRLGAEVAVEIPYPDSEELEQRRPCTQDVARCGHIARVRFGGVDDVGRVAGVQEELDDPGECEEMDLPAVNGPVIAVAEDTAQQLRHDG